MMSTVSPSEAAEDTVEACALLTITHEHGVNTSMHESRRDAEATLAEYVRSWWLSEAGEGVPMPENPSRAIEDYFMDHAPHEDYDITTP